MWGRNKCVYIPIFSFTTIQRDCRWSVRQRSQIPCLQRLLFQHVILEIPWMEVYPPKPPRREVLHIPGTKNFRRNLASCDSVVEVTQVHLDSTSVWTCWGCWMFVSNSEFNKSQFWVMKRWQYLLLNAAFFREISGWPVGTVSLVFSRMLVSCN